MSPGREFSKWVVLIWRGVMAILILAIVVVGGLTIKAMLEPERSNEPRTALERDYMDAKAAVKANPKSAKARLQLGIVLASMGRYDDSINELKQAMRLDPKNREAHYAMGLVYKDKGDEEKAIDYLEKAIKLHADEFPGSIYSEAYYDMGQIYYEQKKYDKAIEAFEKAEMGNPTASDVVLALAEAYEKAGRKQDAISAYRGVLRLDSENKEAKDGLKRLGAKP